MNDIIDQGEEATLQAEDPVAAPGAFENITAKQAGSRVRLDTTIDGIFDPETGVPAVVTPAGALKVSEIVHLIGDVFGPGPLPSTKWDIVTANSATQLETNGELIMATNGGVDANVSVTSISRARFYPGHFNTGHIAAQLSTVWADTDTIAEWGAYDAGDVTGDGIFMRFTGGDFSIVTRRSGVETEVLEGDFNGSNPIDKNTNTNVYEIGYNAGTARFLQGPNVFHTQSAAAGPFIGTPHLKVGARIYNDNGHNGDHDIRFRALGTYRVGRPFAVPEAIYIDSSGATVIKDTPGTLHRVVISRQGGGSSLETITFHDGDDTGDPIICVIAMSANDNKSHSFGHVFNNGLTVDLSSSAFDLTVVYD